ncbi:hypothetical protein Tco_1367494 [Tanacetum coccineum]
MSQPANDDYSQHLSDDEASYHEDASDNGTATNKPKQQQQQLTPTTTTISNIKLPILKKEEYDIWAMEMEHYLEYIDNDVWKVIQNGNSKKRISTGKDGVVRILPPVSAAEIHAVEKERKARTILLMAIPKEHLRRFHGMDDAKEIWEVVPSNNTLNSWQAHCAELYQYWDANHKFLRSLLPPSLVKTAMTNGTKPRMLTTCPLMTCNKTLGSLRQELTSTSKSICNVSQMLHFVSQQQEQQKQVNVLVILCPISTYTPSTSSNNILEREVTAGLCR